EVRPHGAGNAKVVRQAEGRVDLAVGEGGGCGDLIVNRGAGGEPVGEGVARLQVELARIAEAVVIEIVRIAEVYREVAEGRPDTAIKVDFHRGRCRRGDGRTDIGGKDTGIEPAVGRLDIALDRHAVGLRNAARYVLRGESGSEGHVELRCD